MGKYRGTGIGLALCLSFAASQGFAQETQTTLRFSHFIPPSHPLHTSYQEWADSLKAATNGSISVTIFPAQQLGKAFDQYDMAKNGIADIVMAGPGYEAGRFPIASLVDIPFIFNDGKDGTAAVDQWYRKYAATEMSDVHYCLGFVQYPATLHSRKMVATPADVAGLKVRPPSATVGSLISSLGGTTVTAPPQQTRELIDRGAIDATFVPWGSTILFGIDKVAKYHLDTKTNSWFGTVLMSKTKYDSLSPNQKTAVDSHCNTEWAIRIATPWADFEEAGRPKLVAEGGHEFISLSPAQIEVWKKASAFLWDDWRASVRKAGQDPSQVEAEFRRLLKSKNAEF